MMLVSDDSNTLRLVAEENFSHTFAEALHLKLQETLRDIKGKNVILDMTQVELVDSTGVKLLAGLYKACQEKKLGFSIEVTHPSVSKVLRLCKLDQLIEIREVPGVE